MSLPFAPIQDLKLIAGVGGEKGGHMAQPLGQRRRGQQRVFTLAQVVIIEVHSQRKHVDRQRVGEGRLEETIPCALVDALLPGLAVERAAAGLPRILAGFAADLGLGLRPDKR